MTVNFGDVRSAIHSGGELPEGWMEDERAREYVLGAEWSLLFEVIRLGDEEPPLMTQVMHIKAGNATVLLMSDTQTRVALDRWINTSITGRDLVEWVCDQHRSWIMGDTPPPPWLVDEPPPAMGQHASGRVRLSGDALEGFAATYQFSGLTRVGLTPTGIVSAVPRVPVRPAVERADHEDA